MTHRSRRAVLPAVGWFLGLALCVAGCARSGAKGSLPSGGGSISWSAPATIASPRPGIDQATVVHAGAGFVVWCATDKGGGSVNSGNPWGRNVEGYVNAADGARISFRAKMRHGLGGDATIDGVAHDLAAGGLFLVAHDKGKTRIKQLKRNLAGLEYTVEGLKAFAASDPEFSGFW